MKPEGARRDLLEVGVRDPRRVVERSPEAISVGAFDAQPVAVVHGGAIVVDCRAVRAAEEEHRGQRRHAELGDRLAKEQPRGHVHLGCCARADREVIGAGDARAFERRQYDHLRGPGRRPLEVEPGEARELLGAVGAGVEREAPGAQPVGAPPPEPAEIARAKKGDEFVEDIGTIEPVMQTEARHAGQRKIVRQTLGEFLGILEVARGEAHLPRRALRHLEQAHWLAEQPSGVEAVHVELGPGLAPTGAIGTKADAPIVRVGQLAEHPGRRRRRSVRTARKVAHLLRQQLERETVRRGRCSVLGSCRAGPNGGGNQSCGEPAEGGATIESHRLVSITGATQPRRPSMAVPR